MSGGHLSSLRTEVSPSASIIHKLFPHIYNFFFFPPPPPDLLLLRHGRLLLLPPVLPGRAAPGAKVPPGAVRPVGGEGRAAQGQHASVHHFPEVNRTCTHVDLPARKIFCSLILCFARKKGKVSDVAAFEWHRGICGFSSCGKDARAVCFPAVSNSAIFLCFLFRITPFLPNWFINITSPVLGVSLWPFYVGTFVGVAPPSLIASQVF